MANELDEMTGPVNAQGRDVNVIERQLPVQVGFGSALFEILLWVCGIVPGIIFLFMKISAKNYFQKLQQKIQADASQIDNFLEQRVMILQNVARLVWSVTSSRLRNAFSRLFAKLSCKPFLVILSRFAYRLSMSP